MDNITCSCGFLEEIHGFDTLGEFEKFQNYLQQQVVEGSLSRVNTDKNYEKGLIYGGDWFECKVCKEIWRLVAPDFPFRGLWEKVDR
jgi:hypothetical protein